MGGTPSLGCPWPPALPDHDDDDDQNDDVDDNHDIDIGHFFIRIL